MADDEVEAGHFSPGLVDLKSVFSSTFHETYFRPFTAHFAVGDFHSWIFH
jgi:hypothetical protein